MKNQVETHNKESLDASLRYCDPAELPKPDEEMESIDRLSLQLVPGHAMGFLTIESDWEESGESHTASISLSPDEFRSVAGRLIEIAATLEGEDFEKSEIPLAEHRENC